MNCNGYIKGVKGLAPAHVELCSTEWVLYRNCCVRAGWPCIMIVQGCDPCAILIQGG